jgi:hypothetical protein
VKKYDSLGVAAALMLFAVVAAGLYSYLTDADHFRKHHKQDYAPAPPTDRG